MLRIIKKIWLISILSLFILLPINSIHADETPKVDWINILPELEDNDVEIINTKVERIWSEAWHVWDHYNDEASLLTTEQQIQSWIMNWGTITNYITFVIKFLSQAWIAIWALFIMYAWYKYMISVFQWGQVPKKTITNAIIWVIIVIFSYAIMKTLTSIVWLS